MPTGELLPTIFQILRQLDGYIVLRDEAGGEFIISRKAKPAQDTQLPLPKAKPLAAAASPVLDSINKEIARYSDENREKEIDDLSLEAAKGKRVRFEPITGDLPPELQD